MRTLAEQAAAVASRDVSPAELVDAALRAIDDVRAALNAFTVVLDERARARAKELEGAQPLGPLHGVPVCVKDLFDVRGAVTSGCCDAYRDRVASKASAVVEALEDAGAIVVAKTNQHELACGSTSQISSYGPVANPWDHARIPGGSSGGSGAAVAAGVVTVAIGSDTGGSIRIPASFCGVSGLKPTHGAVSLRGAMPMFPSFDTAGPLATTAADCLLVHAAISGFDPDDPVSVDGRPAPRPASVERLRVAIARSFLDDVDPAVVAAIEAAAKTLDDLGVLVDEISGPALEPTYTAFGNWGTAELADAYRELWDDDRVHASVRAVIGLGRNLSAPDVAGGIAAARDVRRDFEWALTSADAILAPCTPFAAPLREDAERLAMANARLTLPVNVAGLPAIAFPVGLSADGLPLGAQLIGRPWSEEILGALAMAFQDATAHHLARPPALSAS